MRDDPCAARTIELGQERSHHRSAGNRAVKLLVAKARREQYGQSSERGELLVEQLELAIGDLEVTQAEQETKAEIAASEAAKEACAQSPTAPGGRCQTICRSNASSSLRLAHATRAAASGCTTSTVLTGILFVLLLLCWKQNPPPERALAGT
jgi:Transposase C of IS166 homeodomain